VNKQALSLAVFVAGGAYPAVSNALSLGDIESNSNLNQPLKAQIELLSTTAQEARQLQVRLAPPSVFNRVGIDRPAYLENLRFATTIKNGKPVIVVSSDAPIDEPFVNFLVEVSWPQGQLLKEYTVMLDPPVLMQPGSTTASEATVRAEPGASGRVARPAPQPTPRVVQQPRPAPTQVATAPAQPERVARQQVAAQPQPQTEPVQAQPSARPARRSAPNRTYRVRTGDTLYGIAAKARPRELTVDQMMVALYRANPNAFIRENINGLKRGAVLKAPTMDLAQGTTPNAARQQVRQHYNDWKEFRNRAAGTTVAQERVTNTKPDREVKPTQQAAINTNNTPSKPNNEKPELKVLGGNQQPVASNSATAAAGQARLQELENQLSLTREAISSRQRENADLRSRLSELESLVDKKNNALAVGSTQAAAMQEQLAGKPTTALPSQGTLPSTTVNNPVSNGTTPPTTAPSAGSTVAQLPTQQAGVTTPTTTALAPNTTLPATNVNAGTDIAGVVQGLQSNGQGAVNRVPPPTTQQTTTVKPTVDTNTQKPAVTPVPEPTEENDLLSMLTSPLALQIGAGSLLGLLGLGLLWRLLGRRKKKAVTDSAADSVFDLEDDIATPNKGHNIAGADVFANLEDDITHAEQRTDLPVQGATSTKAAKATLKKSEPVVEVKQLTPAAAEEEDDVLMESNVYIAYGLHQQAESELKKAIEKYPERMEYRHKLLENYFAANNRAAFDQAAQEFTTHNGANRDKLWNDIVVWGRKISPDNPLYATGSTFASGLESSLNLGKATAGVAATAGTVAVANAALRAGDDDDDDDFDDYDLDLPDLDLPKTQANLGNDTLALNASQKPEINLTKPSEIKADQPTKESYSAPTITQDDELDDFDFDLDFDEPKLSSSTNKIESTRPTASSMLDELDSLDFDTDPVPTPQTAKTPATPETGLVNLFDELDLGTDKAIDKVAQTTQAAKDSLSHSMDALDGLDSLTSKAGTVAAATVAGASALAAGVANKTQAATMQLDELEELDDADFSALDDLLKEHNLTLGDNAASTAPATASTPISAITDSKAKVTDLALHIKDNDLNKILPENNFYTKSAPSAAAVAPISTPSAKPSQEEEWLGDIDDALSFLDLPDEEIDLHEAHISTKLDLARAYLDMGDIEGARSTLEEVVVEGNDDQRREAQQLLHQAG
jgi:pilus assembly protein FimV